MVMMNHGNGKMRRVAVYCSSKDGLDPEFGRVAEDLGRLIARRGLELVYGGSCVGLMRRLAEATLRCGGAVTGVFPKAHFDEELQQNLTRTILVDSLAERKAKMLELADAWLAMPGGFGTLDEFFDALCLLQIRGHGKPGGLLNIDGYFDHLIRFLDHASCCGMVFPEDRDLVSVSETPAGMLDLLRNRVEGGRPLPELTFRRRGPAISRPSAQLPEIWLS